MKNAASISVKDENIIIEIPKSLLFNYLDDEYQYQYKTFDDKNHLFNKFMDFYNIKLVEKILSETIAEFDGFVLNDIYYNI